MCQWIKTTDRLPEHGGDYLAVIKGYVDEEPFKGVDCYTQGILIFDEGKKMFAYAINEDKLEYIDIDAVPYWKPLAPMPDELLISE